MNRSECCEHCEKREIGCHSPCEKYAAEVIFNTLMYGKRKQENQLRNDEWAVSIRRAKQRTGNWRWKKNDKRLGQK